MIEVWFRVNRPSRNTLSGHWGFFFIQNRYCPGQIEMYGDLNLCPTALQTHVSRFLSSSSLLLGTTTTVVRWYCNIGAIVRAQRDVAANRLNKNILIGPYLLQICCISRDVVVVGSCHKNRVEIDSSSVPIDVSEICRELLLLYIYSRRPKKHDCYRASLVTRYRKNLFSNDVHKIQKWAIFRYECGNIETRH